MRLYRCTIFCGHSLKVIAAFCLNISRYSPQIYLQYLFRYPLMNLHLSSVWELHASPPLKILNWISGRDSFKGGRLWHPRCLFSRYVGRFILILDAQWKFLFLDHIYLHSSSYSWMFHQVWNYWSLEQPNLETVKTFCFSEQTQIRKSISSRNSHPDSFF
jgi:hypothetical protein